MRGTLKQRSKGTWSLIFDLGYQTDPETGLRKRKQKWVTFHGTKKQAETKLTELVRTAHRGEFVEPTKMTFGEWLTEWVDKALKPPRRTAGTYRVYTSTIKGHIEPKLGVIRLQELRALDIERYHADLGLAPATGELHHAIINSALKAALRAGLVYRNVATLVENKPRAPQGHQDVLDHVWTADEARTFVATAKAAGPQPAAFYTLALDSGARKSELAALRWTDLDLPTGRLSIERQLLTGGPKPTFSATKGKTARTIDLAEETVGLLQTHKRHQAEVKLKNRTHYQDHGLIFAKERADVTGRHDTLGAPLAVSTLGQREFARLIKAAGVKRIKVHGLRHTCATLMLAVGVPAHVVQRRLGHSKIEMTLGVYGHVLPAMQQDAAARLAALLHG